VPIHTALGPIEPHDLGPTSMHEHVFVDSRIWLEPSAERNAPPPTAPVALETLGFLRWNPHSLEDNLIVDDPDVCVHELRRVAAAGGSGIVDMTNIGLGRRPADLPDVARRSGVHIMVGCGFYVHDSHPGWVEGRPATSSRRSLCATWSRGSTGPRCGPR
jgi:phosphotriesterase-related protein